jgi:hypothetical protein
LTDNTSPKKTTRQRQIPQVIALAHRLAFDRNRAAQTTRADAPSCKLTGQQHEAMKVNGYFRGPRSNSVIPGDCGSPADDPVRAAGIAAFQPGT